MIRFGPAGLGKVDEAIETLEGYAKQGITACEIAFTYGVYIKSKEDALKIGEAAKRLNIKLSIHGPYWINLNSEDKKKIAQSKQRILSCLEVGTWLGAYAVVFHPAFYGKMSKEETYENVRNELKELVQEAKKKKYTPLICPETMGKVNVFGSLNEILALVKDTGCSCCIDFAHLLARDKKVDYEGTFKRLKDVKIIHIHFSGIEYGEKGEKKHLVTPEKEMKALIQSLPKNKEITVINESPEMIKDSIRSIHYYNKQQ